MQPTYNIDNPNLSYEAKQELWETGFGLQKVDGLTPSVYMEELAERQARGEYTYEQVYEEITKYHQSTDASTQEADIVSLRIVEMLSQNGFSLRPTTLLHIHKELFHDIFDSSIPVVEYRTVNITKNELVLKGDTVIYSDFPLIAATLDYDFQQERDFSYARLDKKAIVAHIQSFISGVWQIHPFREGNTRTITVFLIKYLRSLGLPFQKHAKYFRDALVLDNAKLVNKRSDFLTAFFENLLLNGQNDLSSERMYEELGLDEYQ
ncbi:Fic family protein [Streptococcus suis]|uniref:Fic family protein n=1 Tax=Streptococcus suis TaxID=1307 RepID=UPI001BAF99B4|nr:Fic family protein [Streptococcus suis]MBS0746854.1 Fic family protein [Streptococcus suis]